MTKPGKINTAAATQKEANYKSNAAAVPAAASTVIGAASGNSSNSQASDETSDCSGDNNTNNSKSSLRLSRQQRSSASVNAPTGTSSSSGQFTNNFFVFLLGISRKAIPYSDSGQIFRYDLKGVIL